AMRFFRAPDFEQPFPPAHLQALQRFLATWDNVESEFENEYVGSHLRALRREAAALLRLFGEHAQESFDDSGARIIALRRGIEGSRAHYAGRDRLRGVAATLYLAHQNLVWHGRRLL
ncbi:MAG: hypothetical protein ACREVL_10880, partial [Solimonas sp.]